MKTALWIVQIILSAAFIMAGMMKLFTPHGELVEQMAWASRVSEGMVIFIGLVEVLGAIGLVLPAAVRILPKLTSVSAVGFVVLMLLAAINHGLAGEGQEILINMILASLSAFVAWGRLVKHPIAAK